ncbi:MAG TPA: GDP-mannose 4,6-dehydratase [Nitrospinaceae bacterium]|jgi:GDPmannose 4,6-dehydratase|nr:GDP-mannose 4,6-dehydratase [Nitrospinaceae bacterium]
MKQKTAFITGITGQDGSYLADFLLEKGYRVIGMKRRTSIISTDRIDHIFQDPDKLENFDLVYGNMNDSGCLHRLLSKYKPDEIYNLAAQSHVRVSFDTPEETADYVALGTLRLLEAVRNTCPETKFYQASSSEMFGDNPEYPQNELTRLMPASPYACSKVFAYNIVRNYRESYGIFGSSGILFNHESPRRGETFVTRKITRAAARIKLGIEDTLYLGNLDAKRDWGFAGDYVEAMWLMLQQDESDDFVVATGETHTVRQFLETVFERAGLSIEKHVQIDERLFRPQEVPILLGDASKAKEVLGWEPKVNFEQLAAMMYEADLKKLFQRGI